MENHVWRRASAKLVPYGALFIAGLIVTFEYGTVRKGNIEHRTVAAIGILFFIIGSLAFLHALGSGVRKSIINHRLGIGRAAALEFIIQIVGYVAVFFIALDRLGIPVGHILLGSAVLGIILGVAAQQALANFFASIVLIIAHPFAVGDNITLVSGSLGGEYKGIVDDIGVTHTRLREDNGNVVKLPNSTILVGGAITVHKNKHAEEE